MRVRVASLGSSVSYPATSTAFVGRSTIIESLEKSYVNRWYIFFGLKSSSSNTFFVDNTFSKSIEIRAISWYGHNDPKQSKPIVIVKNFVWRGFSPHI